MATSEAQNELSATYTSPEVHKPFTSPLPSIDTANRSTKDKTAYLNDLRSKIEQMQQDVNAFLTGKMTEAKAAEELSGARGAANEDKEEEMYGEEDPETAG